MCGRVVSSLWVPGSRNGESEMGTEESEIQGPGETTTRRSSLAPWSWWVDGAGTGLGWDNDEKGPEVGTN